MVACQSSKRESLEAALDRYSQALRHKDLELAVLFVDPEQRDSFTKKFSALDRFYISHIEIQSVLPNDEQNGAMVGFVMEYFDQQGVNLVTSKRGFEWSYDEESKSWRHSEDSPFGRVLR